MPYKSGKLKGELTNAEIRKLIREHNKLVSMKVPVKATREQIIKAVEDKGYTVDHINQRLKPKSAKISGKTVTRNPSIKLSDVPKKVSKPKKVVMKSAPKEDEVRPARIGAPPIPKAKDFVKVGVKPKKQARIDTNAPRNVGKVDTTKPKKEDKTKNPGVGFKIADYLKKRGLKLKPRDFSSIAKVLNSGKIKSLTLSPGDAFIGFTGPDDTRYAYSVFNRIVLKKPKKTAKEGTPKKEKKEGKVKKAVEKIEKKQIDSLSLEYISEIKKMTPLKTLAQIQSTYKKYEKKIYDTIGTNVDNYEELREYWDDNWSDKISEAIPDGRKGTGTEEKKELNQVEKNRCIKAVNNARSVITLYEEKEGKIKDSAFSSKKDLMETINDLKEIRPQLKLCPKSEQDIVDKALSLHSKGPTKKGKVKKQAKN